MYIITYVYIYIHIYILMRVSNWCFQPILLSAPSLCGGGGGGMCACFFFFSANTLGLWVAPGPKKFKEMKALRASKKKPEPRPDGAPARYPLSGDVLARLQAWGSPTALSMWLAIGEG